MTVWNNGFEPVINAQSKILILGSFPSVKSREVGFYYGNPQNRFWKMLEYTFSDNVPKDTEGKKQYLFSHNVALYDVIEKSTIKGSSDSDINERNSVPVNINELLKTAPNLRLIICNGKKSFEIFNKMVKGNTVETVYMPSTSSANVGFDVEKWKITLQKYLNNN